MQASAPKRDSAIVPGAEVTWVGRPLRDTPQLRGWAVLAIQSGANVHLPHPEDTIEPGNVLIVAGPPGSERALQRGLDCRPGTRRGRNSGAPVPRRVVQRA